MLQFKLLFLLIASSSFLGGCIEPRKDLTICVIDSYTMEMHCSDPRGVIKSIRLVDADNYVCMAPDDFDELVKILSKKCR